MEETWSTGEKTIAPRTNGALRESTQSGHAVARGRWKRGSSLVRVDRSIETRLLERAYWIRHIQVRRSNVRHRGALACPLKYLTGSEMLLTEGTSAVAPHPAPEVTWSFLLKNWDRYIYFPRCLDLSSWNPPVGSASSEGPEPCWRRVPRAGPFVYPTVFLFRAGGATAVRRFFV